MQASIYCSCVFAFILPAISLCIRFIQNGVPCGYHLKTYCGTSHSETFWNREAVYDPAYLWQFASVYKNVSSRLACESCAPLPSSGFPHQHHSLPSLSPHLGQKSKSSSVWYPQAGHLRILPALLPPLTRVRSCWRISLPDPLEISSPTAGSSS